MSDDIIIPRAADDYVATTKPDRPITRARAVGLRPAGSRKLWCWVVGRCVFCGGGHIHRSGPNGGERLAGCGRGRYRFGPK